MPNQLIIHYILKKVFIVFDKKMEEITLLISRISNLSYQNVGISNLIKRGY